MDAEERVRREAVRWVLAGELVVDVAGALGRTERWVFKWLSRYDPQDEGWARSRSRAPERVANRSDPKLEALVLKVRERLQANPWAQIGAAAIAWELAKLRLRRIPELRTIERILERAGAPRRERRVRYAAKGTPYPVAARPAANELQEADLVGPRHLAGAIPFYAFNVVDVGRHAAAVELHHNAHHRYAVLGRATPAEFAARAGFQPRLLAPGFRVPEKLPRRGRVEFIRLIRSDRLLHVLGERIVLGPDVVHEYVTAILHVRRGEIEVVHGGRTVKRLDFALRD